MTLYDPSRRAIPNSLDKGFHPEIFLMQSRSVASKAMKQSHSMFPKSCMLVCRLLALRLCIQAAISFKPFHSKDEGASYSSITSFRAVVFVPYEVGMW